MIDKKLTNFKQTNVISIYIGIFLIFLSLIFLFLKSFINIDLLSFLPFSLKLIFYFSSGLLGLYLIRSEKSEIKIIEIINKKSLKKFLLNPK